MRRRALLTATAWAFALTAVPAGPVPQAAAGPLPDLAALLPPASGGTASGGASTADGASPAVSSGPLAEPVATAGKLIWELADGRLGSCSGAVVEADNGSVVATAAHCAEDALADGGPSVRAWFVPGYHRDAAAFRRDGWRVAAFHLPDGWVPGRAARDNLPHDYAFLTLARRDGRTVQQVHGANRPAFAPVPEDRPVLAVGYPAAPPYDGEDPYHCAGPTEVLTADEAASFNVGGLLLADCPLTEGASGGPWLQDYDPATGSGTLVAVTSAGTGRGEVVGRPCPPEARALLDRAGRHRPPG